LKIYVFYYKIISKSRLIHLYVETLKHGDMDNNE